jgi:acetyl esterase/lipase
VDEKETENRMTEGILLAVAPHMRYAPAKHNICLVSADYRLAPQTRMPAILSDCKSAIDFLRTEQFKTATEGRVNTAKIFVSGSSAGGWLALLAGTGISYHESGERPPRGIHGVVAIYPITDLFDPFWTTKHRPVSYLDRIIDHSEMETFVDPNSEKTSWSDPTGKRSMFYSYMVQE